MEIDWSLWKSRIQHFTYWFQTHPWAFYILGVVILFLGVLSWNNNGSGAGVLFWIIVGCIFILLGMVCQFGFWG